MATLRPVGNGQTVPVFAGCGAGWPVGLTKVLLLLHYVNVNTITIDMKEAAAEGRAGPRESDPRVHEMPRIVSWEVARRVQKGAPELDAPAISSKAERE